MIKDINAFIPQADYPNQELYDSNYNSNNLLTSLAEFGHDNGVWWAIEPVFDTPSTFHFVFKIRKNLDEDWVILHDTSLNPNDGKFIVHRNDYTTNLDLSIPSVFFVNGVWILPLYSKTTMYTGTRLDYWGNSNPWAADFDTAPLKIKFRISTDNFETLSDPIEVNFHVENDNTKIRYGHINDLIFKDNRWIAVLSYASESPTPAYNNNKAYYEKIALCNSVDITDFTNINNTNVLDNWVCNYKFALSEQVAITSGKTFISQIAPLSKLLATDEKIYLFAIELNASYTTSDFSNYTLSNSIRYLEVDLPLSSNDWSYDYVLNGTGNTIWNAQIISGSNIPFTTLLNYPGEFGFGGVFRDSASQINYFNFNYSLWSIMLSTGLQFSTTVEYNFSNSFSFPKFKPNYRDSYYSTTDYKGQIFSLGNRFFLKNEEFTNANNLKVSNSNDIFSGFTNFNPLNQNYVISDWIQAGDNLFFIGGRSEGYGWTRDNLIIYKTDLNFENLKVISNSFTLTNFGDNYYISKNSYDEIIIYFHNWTNYPLISLYKTVIGVEFASGDWITDFEGEENYKQSLLNDLEFYSFGGALDAWVSVGTKWDWTSIENPIIYDIATWENFYSEDALIIGVGDAIDYYGYTYPLICYKTLTGQSWNWLLLKDFGEASFQQIKLITSQETYPYEFVVLGSSYENLGDNLGPLFLASYSSTSNDLTKWNIYPTNIQVGYLSNESGYAQYPDRSYWSYYNVIKNGLSTDGTNLVIQLGTRIFTSSIDVFKVQTNWNMLSNFYGDRNEIIDLVFYQNNHWVVLSHDYEQYFSGNNTTTGYVYKIYTSPELDGNWTLIQTFNLTDDYGGGSTQFYCTPIDFALRPIMSGSETNILFSVRINNYWSNIPSLIILSTDDVNGNWDSQLIDLTAQSIELSELWDFEFFPNTDVIGGNFVISGADSNYIPAILKIKSDKTSLTSLTNNSSSIIDWGTIFSVAYLWLDDIYAVGYSSLYARYDDPDSAVVFKLGNYIQTPVPPQVQFTLNDFVLDSEFFSIRYNPQITYKTSNNLKWIESTTLDNINGGILSIKFSNPYWVAAGNLDSKAAVYVSDNPPGTWTTQILGAGKVVSSRVSIGFDGSTWAITAYDNLTSTSAIYTATNPLSTWTETSSPYHIVLLDYHVNKWIAIAYNSNDELILLTATTPTGTWNTIYNFSAHFNDLGYPQDLIWDGIRTIVVTEKSVLFNNNSLTNWTQAGPLLNPDETFTSLYYSANNPKYILVGNKIDNNRLINYLYPVSNAFVFEAFTIDGVWTTPTISFLQKDYSELFAIRSDLKDNWYAVGSTFSQTPTSIENSYFGYITGFQGFTATRYFVPQSSGGGGGGSDFVGDLMIDNSNSTEVEPPVDDTARIDRPDPPINPKSPIGSGKLPEKFIEPLRIRFQWDAPDENKEFYSTDVSEGLAPGQTEAHRYYVVVQRKPSSTSPFPAINNSDPTATPGVERAYTSNLYYLYNIPQHDPTDAAAVLRNHRAIIWSQDILGTFSDGYFNTDGIVKGQSGIQMVKVFTINGELQAKKYPLAFTAHRNLKITSITARIDGPPVGGPILLQLVKYNADDTYDSRVLSFEDRLMIKATHHIPVITGGQSGAQIEAEEIDFPFLNKGQHLFLKIVTLTSNPPSYLGNDLTLTVAMEPVTPLQADV